MSCSADAAPVSATVAVPTATFTATVEPTASPAPASPVVTPHPVISTNTPRPAAPTPTPTAPPAPTHTPTRSPTKTRPTGESGVKVYPITITLPTYPVWDYLVEQIDPVYNMPVYYFNRAGFEADAPAPLPTDYEGVALENPYLRLIFLPELGGRLYSAVVKSTGQEIFYHNPVVKPSRYGILEPYKANWWLASGGMDWAYPTQEHGYRFGVPWQVRLSQSAAEATITLSDIAPDRLGVEVSVTLPADSAAFTVRPRLVNAGTETVPVQFWVNAALALAPGSMSPNTQFIVPAAEVVVHSRGEEGWAIPAARQTAPWPNIGPLDLSDYRQWANYLGFFVPYLKAPFMGAYNPQADLGVARLVEPGVVPGNKLFAFGSNFPDR
ncbi:MAG: DUF5107 domain-containing protein, partial [Chloroflexota bacterium]